MNEQQRKCTKQYIDKPQILNGLAQLGGQVLNFLLDILVDPFTIAEILTQGQHLVTDHGQGVGFGCEGEHVAHGGETDTDHLLLDCVASNVQEEWQ
jgi:hypothetical protein